MSEIGIKPVVLGCSPEGYAESVCGMGLNRPKRGRPVGSIVGKYPRKAGGKATVLYQTWQGMITRCHSPKSHIWKYYGGRGIFVCELWRARRTGFDAFCDHMGQRPSDLHSIDRIDNDRGYEPGNCKWSTQKEQCANRRPGGMPKNPNSLMQKCVRAGLPYLQVRLRIKKLGWTEDRALSTPMRRWNLKSELTPWMNLPNLV